MLEFRFVLAGHLGMTVGAMMSQMSALEESYWVAFNRASPIGEYRADIRNAQVLQLLYQINAGSKAPKKKITDWLPFYRKRTQPDEHVTTKVRSLFGNIIKHQD